MRRLGTAVRVLQRDEFQINHHRDLERFPAKHAPGLDPGVGTGSREENASKQETRAFSDLAESEGIPFLGKS